MPKSFLRTDEDFEAFYLRHVDAVYRICFAFMKNPQDAEDCTEDVFVRAMTAEVIFENERHERSWLTTTAMNLCKDKRKSWWKQKVISMPPSDETEKEEDSVPDMEHVLAAAAASDAKASFDTPEKAMERKLLRQEILSLPEKYKQVVWLYYYDGYQTDEIAKMLKRPASTIRNQLRDARGKLKQLLGGEDT